MPADVGVVHAVVGLLLTDDPEGGRRHREGDGGRGAEESGDDGSPDDEARKARVPRGAHVFPLRDEMEEIGLLGRAW